MESGPRPKTALLPLILITTLFFLWGVANNLNDVLIPQFKKAFTLNDWQSGLVQSAFYLGYFLLALPAGMVMRRLRLQVGRGARPGAVRRGRAAVLSRRRGPRIFLVPGRPVRPRLGLAFLETSANPLITVLGDPAKSEQRLNFAQAFNPAGAITAMVIGREFILSGVSRPRPTSPP
jgi:FHS family L-fucose permease-like MFS transporter